MKAILTIILIIIVSVLIYLIYKKADLTLIVSFSILAGWTLSLMLMVIAGGFQLKKHRKNIEKFEIDMD